MNGQEFTKEVARLWGIRRDAQQLKIRSVAHQKAQLEFFLGAFSAASITGQECNNNILMLLTVGTDACELFKDGL